MRTLTTLIVLLTSAMVLAANNTVEYTSSIFTVEGNDFYLMQQLDTVNNTTDTYLCHLELSRDRDNFEGYNPQPRMLLRVGENVKELTSIDWQNPGDILILKEYMGKNGNYYEWHGFVIMYELDDQLTDEIINKGVSKVRYETTPITSTHLLSMAPMFLPLNSALH